MLKPTFVWLDGFLAASEENKGIKSYALEKIGCHGCIRQY